MAMLDEAAEPAADSAAAVMRDPPRVMTPPNPLDAGGAVEGSSEEGLIEAVSGFITQHAAAREWLGCGMQAAQN